MHASVFDRPAFRPVPLLALLALATALFGSWAYIDTTRALWDTVDETVFRTLNDSLRNHPWWQHLWALGNNHFFDFLSSVLMVWLAFRYIMADGPRYVHERVCVVLYIALVIGAAVLTVDKLLVGEKRFSPTAQLDDVFLLTQHVTWLDTKDLSYNCFPSDHATVLMMVTGLLWFFAGRKTGLIMLAATLFFSFPRLIGGAHWLTDMAVGAMALSIVAVALAVYTPLYHYVIRGLLRTTRIPFVAAGIDVVMHRDAPILFAKGCCIGAADVVPGVSGGTMAYILGVWLRLMNAIKSFNVKWVRTVLRGQWTLALQTAHFAFLVPLVVGIGGAFITFTRFIPLPKLLITHPEPIYGLFFGLIAGSVVLLVEEIGRITFRELVIGIVGLAGGWVLVNLVPVETPEDWWFIYLCGCIAITAMLLPGISGSFMLLILGKYSYVFGAIGDFNFAVILPFALGCLTGVILFARVASWILHHYYRESVVFIIGVLISSMWLIWPFQDRTYAIVREKERLISSTPNWPAEMTSQDWFGLGMMAFGFVLVVTIGVIAKKKALAAQIKAAKDDEHLTDELASHKPL